MSFSKVSPILSSVVRSWVLFEVVSFEVVSFEVQSFEVGLFEVQLFEVGSFEVGSFVIQSLVVQAVNRTSAASHCSSVTVYILYIPRLTKSEQDEMSHRHTVHTTTPHQVVHPQAFVLIKEEFV
jgi:hypothetical protein